MTEASCKAKLIKELRARGAFVQAIESHATSVGIPDLYVATSLGSCWIECKYVDYDKSTCPHKPLYVEQLLGKGQKAWHLNHAKATGRSPWVVVFHKWNKKLEVTSIRLCYSDAKEKWVYKYHTLQDSLENTVTTIIVNIAPYNSIVGVRREYAD